MAYYTTFNAGLWSTPAGTARSNTYYGITGYPTIVWQGNGQRAVGAGTSDGDGRKYEKIYQSLKGPSAWAIQSIAFDTTGGSVDFQVKIVSAPGNTAGLVFRSILYEDDLTCPGNAPGCLNGTTRSARVTRQVLVDEPITVSAIGQTQTIHKTWTVDPLWVKAKLNVVGFIQRDATKEVLQAGSTIPKLTYSFNYWSDAGQVVVKAGVPVSFALNLYNSGTGSDNFTATLAKLKGPADWTTVVADGATSSPNSLTWPLTPETTQPFRLDVTQGTRGYGVYTVTLSQTNNPAKTRTITFSIVTEGLPVLLVDDDSGAAYQADYIAALDAASYQYGVWDNTLGLMPAPALTTFPIVVWEVGFDVLYTASRNRIGAYLDAGGKLMLCGQDIGWYFFDPANSGCPDAGVAQPWYQNYLHATWLSDTCLPGNPPPKTGGINGVVGDPIGNGWSFNILNPPYSLYPDVVNPRDAQTYNAFTYATGGGGGGLRVTDALGIFHQIVYLPWGIEQIDPNAQCPPASGTSCKNAVTKASIDWLGYAPLPSCSAGNLSRVPGLKLSRTTGTQDIVYTWDNSDPEATAGFNVYSTNTASFLGNLNANGGCGADCNTATLTGMAGPKATLINGVTSGKTFHQVVSSCDAGIEGPN